MDANVVSSWDVHFDSLFDNHVGEVFARRDLRHQARGYVRGLLSSVERKNSWQLAEHLGQEKPFGIQRLLSRASWDADALRDELIRYASDPQEGKKVGRRAATVLGDGRSNRELSDRRLPGALHIQRTRLDRSRVVPARIVV